MTDDIVCCPLTGNDGDGPTFCRTTTVRARKPYLCTECRETIAVGQKYECTNGKWEDSFNTYRTCLSCVEIRDHFACNGWLFGRLWEDLEDNFFPEMRAGGDCMKGLSPEAKARLFEKCLKRRGLQDE